MKKRGQPKKTRNSQRSEFLPTYVSFTAITVAVAVFVLVIKSANVPSPTKYSILGFNTLLARGDDDGDNSGSGSSNSGSGSSPSGNSGTNQSGSSNSDSDHDDDEDDNETDSEERGEASTRSRSETDDEERTEVRLSEEERIRVRTQDGRTRIDITAGGIKTRLEYREDRVIVKAEQEDGTEVELEDDTLLKIEERLADDQIKVSTLSGERFVIQRGNAGAVTQFPLSIDLATNTLIVTTPAGEKTVAVLPDQAVQNLIAANVIHRIGASTLLDQVESEALTSVSQVVTLGEQSGVPVYEISGISDQKLLGFIPVAIEKTVIVSAESGDVVSTQTSLVDQAIDLLSF